MNSVKAKFVTESVTSFTGCEQIKARPVYSQDPDNENGQFWQATPSGTLEMQINNEQAFGFFKPGQEFYLTFERAE